MELVSRHVVIVPNGVHSTDVECDVLCHGGVFGPRVALDGEALVNLENACDCSGSVLSCVGDHESQPTEAVLLFKRFLAYSRSDIGIVGVRRAVVACVMLVSVSANLQQYLGQVRSYLSRIRS